MFLYAKLDRFLAEVSDENGSLDAAFSDRVCEIRLHFQKGHNWGSLLPLKMWVVAVDLRDEQREFEEMFWSSDESRKHGFVKKMNVFSLDIT